MNLLTLFTNRHNTLIPGRQIVSRKVNIIWNAMATHSIGDIGNHIELQLCSQECLEPLVLEYGARFAYCGQIPHN